MGRQVPEVAYLPTSKGPCPCQFSRPRPDPPASTYSGHKRARAYEYTRYVEATVRSCLAIIQPALISSFLGQTGCPSNPNSRNA